MQTGSMQRHRQLLWSQREAISTLFSGKVNASEIDNFIKYGELTGGVKEKVHQRVHEIVAQQLRTGKVVFD